MSKHRAVPATTRESLLDHALTLFSERGYAATSIRDIIHATGVTQPTLYHHFQDKRSLFEELIQLHYEMSQANIEQVLSAENGCEARLRLLVTSSFEFCNSDPRVPRLMFQTYQGPHVPEIDGILDKLTDRRFRLVTKIMEDGILEGRLQDSPPEFLALSFCCLMDQPINLFTRRSRPGRYLTGNLANSLVSLFLNGTARRESL
jgi:AcrR family transcriptional regulator